MTPPSLIKDDAKDEAGSVKSKENDNLKLEMPLHITYIHSDQIVSEICNGCENLFTFLCWKGEVYRFRSALFITNIKNTVCYLIPKTFRVGGILYFLLQNNSVKIF